MLTIKELEKGNLVLEGEATIHTAGVLKSGLIEIFDDEVEEWTVDLSSLELIDCAGAQVLLAFKLSARKLTYHSCPARHRETVEKLGLSHELF